MSKIVGIIVSMALVAAAIHYADQAVSANRATAYVCGYMEGERVILSQYGLGSAKQAIPEQDECRIHRFNAYNFGFWK